LKGLEIDVACKKHFSIRSSSLLVFCFGGVCQRAKSYACCYAAPNRKWDFVGAGSN
jgi:hypothetical protein